MPYFSSIGEKIVTQSVKLMQPIAYMVPWKPIELYYIVFILYSR